MKNLVVLTGAGISAESGVKTFRDSGGLWENHNVMDVASYDGWLRNPSMVLEFYNQRRLQLADVSPNRAHLALAELEEIFNVIIITQNVDDLHERAGSKNILHIHGELTKVRSTQDENYIVDIGYTAMNLGDTAPDGSQLRPHIVWFGEAVPAIEEASKICQNADVFLIIGTSLNVYPAAGLIHYVPFFTPVYYLDPNPTQSGFSRKVTIITKNASEGMEEILKKLKSDV